MATPKLPFVPPKHPSYYRYTQRERVEPARDKMLAVIDPNESHEKTAEEEALAGLLTPLVEAIRRVPTMPLPPIPMVADYVTIDAGPNLLPLILDFPGGPSDVRVAEKVWVYVFQGRQCVIEAWVGTGGLTKVSYQVEPQASTKLGGNGDNFAGQPGTLPIDLRPLAERPRPGDLAVFYSSWRLDQDSLAQLSNVDYVRSHALVPCTGGLGFILAMNLEPVDWAVQAIRQYAGPARDDWLDFLLDKDRRAKTVISTVLKGWVEGPDGDKIRKRLKPGEPEAWISKYANIEQQKRTGFEAAHGYVIDSGHDSEGYHLILQAMMVGDDDSVEALAIAEQIIASELDNSEVGRRYLRAIGESGSSFLGRQIFDAQHGQYIWADLSSRRYGWAALYSLTVDLFATVKGERIKQAAERDKLAGKVAALGLAANKAEVSIVARGTKLNYTALTPGSPTLTLGGTSFPTDASGTLNLSHGARSEFNPVLNGTGVQWKKLFKTSHLGIRIYFDIMNLIVGYEKVSSTLNVSNFANMVSASVDMATLVSRICSWGGEEGGVAWRRLRGVAVVSSLATGLCAGAELNKAWSRGLTGQWIGQTLVVVGSLASAALAFVQLVRISRLAGLSTGIPGLIWALVAEGLVLAGTATVAYFTLTPAEEFATFSFLGVDGPAKTQAQEDAGDTFGWTDGRMPCFHATEELKRLMALLSAFRVTIAPDNEDMVTAGWMPNRLSLDFGLIENSGEVRIELSLMLPGVSGDPLQTSVWIGPTGVTNMGTSTGEGTDGLIFDEKRAVVRRNGEGFISGFELALLPVWVRNRNRLSFGFETPENAPNGHLEWLQYDQLFYNYKTRQKVGQATSYDAVVSVHDEDGVGMPRNTRYRFNLTYDRSGNSSEKWRIVT